MADIEKKDLENETASAPAEKAKKDSKQKGEKKPSVFSRIAGWFRSCKAEMKKVVWAAPKTVVRNSVMVIIAITVVALALMLLDFVFSQGIIGLNKII